MGRPARLVRARRCRRRPCARGAVDVGRVRLSARPRLRARHAGLIMSLGMGCALRITINLRWISASLSCTDDLASFPAGRLTRRHLADGAMGVPPSSTLSGILRGFDPRNLLSKASEDDWIGGGDEIAQMPEATA